MQKSTCVKGKQGDQIARTFIGQLFTSGRFIKITEIASKFGIFFPKYRIGIYFEQKMGWATFWAIFS
jgi:hypothetical protein